MDSGNSPASLISQQLLLRSAGLMPRRSCRHLNYSAAVFCFCVRAATVILDGRYLMICCRRSLLRVVEWLFSPCPWAWFARRPWPTSAGQEAVTAMLSAWLCSSVSRVSPWTQHQGFSFQNRTDRWNETEQEIANFSISRRIKQGIDGKTQKWKQ